MSPAISSFHPYDSASLSTLSGARPVSESRLLDDGGVKWTLRSRELRRDPGLRDGVELASTAIVGEANFSVWGWSREYLRIDEPNKLPLRKASPGTDEAVLPVLFLLGESKNSSNNRRLGVGLTGGRAAPSPV
jgi:hypothetical protein